MNAVTAVYRVPDDHPAFAGHFPGRPILPGVVLLDQVFAAAGVRPGLLLRAKFTAPVGPGEAVELRIEPRGADRFAFTCTSGGRVVLSGEAASCAPATQPSR